MDFKAQLGDFMLQLGGFWVPTCMILLLRACVKARGRLPQALRLSTYLRTAIFKDFEKFAIFLKILRSLQFLSQRGIEHGKSGKYGKV